ncbi:hypothetical protein T440DRAFT_513151 [Plenodomus tracheiphilus IPT5]|uniref:Uncharacterized protein n=1 Tax=Plenodomus tracheiphilus IPT5 TaxID=1408161 RepID=A0A6A7BNS5_9PLEO|nr:hypothetical protein T440DRAFT_513151 [Plenodomus tracheiphilus IPT5]
MQPAFSVITLAVKLPGGVILVMTNPDCSVYIDGFIQLQKSTATKKRETAVQPHQAVREGLDKFHDDASLGCTFEEVNLSGGTYAGPVAINPSASMLMKWGKDRRGNRLLKRTEAAQAKPGKNQAGTIEEAKRDSTSGRPARPAQEQVFRRAHGLPKIKREPLQGPSSFATFARPRWESYLSLDTMDEDEEQMVEKTLFDGFTVVEEEGVVNEDDDFDERENGD